MKYLLLILTVSINYSTFSQGNSPYDSLLINKNENLLIPGYSVLAGGFDSILYQTQYGYADIKNEKIITKNTRFRIGSITKQFTAVGILKLVQEGKIDLTSSAQQYVEFLPKNITIEHLLWHTSGLVSYFNDLDIPDSCFMINYTSADLVSLLEGKKRTSKPNREYHYNNSGYHLLGYIIEQVSGKSYSNYLKDNFFTPFDMKDTECENASSNIENLGFGYEYVDSNLTIPDYYTMDWPYSAGNIVSKPSDLLKWNNALFQGKIIADSLLKYAHTAHILKNGESTHYGYGWEIRKIQDESTLRHSGFLDGYLSTLIFIPKHNVSVVVLTNCSNYSTELFATKLAALAIGKPIYNPKKIELKRTVLERFENHYDFDKDVIVFAIIEEELCFYFDDDPSIYHPLYPIKKNMFYSNEYGCTVTFDNEVNSMTLKIGERETTGKKLNTTKPKPH
jgi:CubicO group peptidase (beta-lactamase class C family)